VITRPGYAIEYDFFDPRHLKPSLESKAIKGLFLLARSMGRRVMKKRPHKV